MTRAASKGGWGRCVTCAHPDRAAIEGAIDGGQPIAKVAKSFGVSRSALHRHLSRHRSGALVHIQPALVIRAGGSDDAIAGELQSLLLTARQQLESAGSVTQALAATDTVLKVVVALGAWQERVLARKPAVALNVLSSAQYMAARWILLDVLTPYPEIRAEIARRFKAAELDTAAWPQGDE